MAMTIAEQMAAKAEQMESVALMFEDLKEFQRTQPALYQAMCDYGTHLRAGNDEKAFVAAGDIAAHVLALAAGLRVTR